MQSRPPQNLETTQILSRGARLHERAANTHTGHRFGTAGVRDVNELIEELSVLRMVPVAEDDSEFVVVRVLFCRWVNYNRGTEAVYVLSLYTERSTEETVHEENGRTPACEWIQ